MAANNNTVVINRAELEDPCCWGGASTGLPSPLPAPALHPPPGSQPGLAPFRTSSLDSLLWGGPLRAPAPPLSAPGRTEDRRQRTYRPLCPSPLLIAGLKLWLSLSWVGAECPHVADADRGVRGTVQDPPRPASGSWASGLDSWAHVQGQEALPRPAGMACGRVLGGCGLSQP